MVIYMGCDGVLYAFSLFVPTIIKNLGYSSTRAQLLTVPPYAIAAVVTVIVGYTADRTQKRGNPPNLPLESLRYNPTNLTQA